MADTTVKTVRESVALEPETKEDRARESEKTPELGGAREQISGTLAEGQKSEMMEGMESGEVREMASEGRETKGDSAMKTRGKGAGAGTKAGGFAFTFDEKNLPPVPDMIRKIEEYLRAEIHHLEKQARYYKGGIFRKPDYHKHNEAVIKIREKTVLLKRLLYMAVDAIKKLFLHMFGTVRT